MKTKLLLLLTVAVFQLKAQVSTEIYGLYRNNTPPELYLGKVNTADGSTELLGATLYDSLLVVTGSTLNPYTNTYHVLSADRFFAIDNVSGEITDAVTVTLPIENSYMRSVVFNPSDSGYYGLIIQTNELDASILFGKIDPLTGIVEVLSDTSITQFLMPGRNIINPYEMIYYLLTDSQIIGIDMYTGDIYSTATITNPYGAQFDNMSFNCKDGVIYGLIPAIDTQLVFLGKLDPFTGAVELVFETAVDTTYFISGLGTANSAIDPVTNTYYYISAGNLKGIDLADGSITFENSIYDMEGRYFGLFHHVQDCFGAQRTRFATGINTTTLAQQFILTPNPTKDFINISFSENIQTLQLMNAAGQIVLAKDVNAKNITINTGYLSPGIYFAKGKSLSGNLLSGKIMVIE